MTSPLQDALQRTLGAGYRIDRELGGGGMSRVFLATDLTLDRQVVVKVLSHEMSAGVSADRFRREIQLVAKLQHPHVVPLLSAGDAEGALFYVMPFISGEPLRARMAREGPMKIGDVVPILRETLDALAFAHSHGVIHRDIKPDNILIGAGHAVVADFGVSKALQDSGTSGELTSVGIALGTPAYMAPEQAAADPTADHRADLYSTAVVAYEMITGAPPFAGTPSQLLKAHLADAPSPIKQRRSDIPDALAELVMRALEKDADKRPQSAGEMMAVLQAVTTPGGTQASAVATPPAPMPAAAPRKSKLPLVVAAALVVIAAAAGWFAMRPNLIASAQALAVTPFSVADGDTALVRLGQNLVTTMSANLDGVGDIRVADAMAVLSHAKTKGALLSVGAAVDIARTLGARSVVHGTLTRSGATVRADMALYDVRTPDAPAVRYGASVPLDSLTALTDSLTWGLLRGVWAKGGAPSPNVGSVSTRSPVALREFLEGERLFARGGPDEAAEAYRRAIAADTTFWFAHYRFRIARSWFGRAADTTISHRLGRHIAELPERERLLLLAIDSTQTHTQRQRQLSALIDRYPDYTPALLSYGDFILHHAIRSGWDVRDAIRPFRRLVELMPSDVAMTEHLAITCLAAGDLTCASSASARVDSMIRTDRPLGFTAGSHRTTTFFASASAPSVDSLVREIRRDTIPLFSAQMLGIIGASLGVSPDRLAAADLVDSSLATFAPMRALMEGGRFSDIARGDGSAFDSVRDEIARGPRPPPAILFLTRTQFLLEAQGLRAPSGVTADEALLLASRPDATPASRIEARWIAGASALWRGDSAAFRARLAELGRDTSANARTAVRSLRALAIGRGGNRAAAAESLLVVEREHGERRALPVGAIFATNRILGAEWLAEAGRFAPADSLLRYTRGYPIGVPAELSQITYGAAQLLRSRIAEGLGNKADAIGFATTFLAAFDRAPPEAKPRIDEARARIARLGGPPDSPRTTKVP